MRALWWTVVSRFKSRERLEAENLALRHQGTVLRRSPLRSPRHQPLRRHVAAAEGGRFALKPDHLAGDVAYGTGEMLGWLVGRDIDPHIPVWDQSKVAPDGKFSCVRYRPARLER